MFASILFDLILLAILGGGVFLGIKKGFIKTVTRPIKLVASIALALSLATSVGMAVIAPIVGPAISNKVSDALVEKYSDITAETANEELPTLIKFAASVSGVDVSDVASQADGITAIEAVVDAVTDPVVKIVSSIAGFILVYFVAKVLLGLGLNLLNTAFKGGIVGTTNKVLGAIFMFLLAFIAAWTFTALSEFILNIPLIANAKWIENFNGGILYRFFRLFTPIDLLLSF